MKELSIEEKAQRYDEILARAKGANLPYYKEDIMSKVKEFVDYLLPELNDSKESEDERIRKALQIYLDWLDGRKDYAPKGEYTIRDMLAWIEKQGQVKESIISQHENKMCKENDDPLTSEDERIRKELIEQVVYIVPNDDEVDNEGNVLPTYQKRIDKYRAWLKKQGQTFTKKDVDDAYLKGVTDTKNEIEKQYEANYQIRKDIATFIFNYRGDIKDRAKWMDYLGIKVSFIEKQGEQKPTIIIPKFRVGDEIKTTNETPLTITKIDEKGYWSESLFICSFDNADKWKLVEQNPAWSEEDEQYLLVCKNALAKYQTTDKWDANIIFHWLENKIKSLRPQKWKPTEKQIMALKWALNRVPYDSYTEELHRLLEQLKQL